MIRILLAGCTGKMGQIFAKSCEDDPEFSIVVGFARSSSITCPFPVLSDLNQCSSSVDVLVDFSSPCALDPILSYCHYHSIPAVLAVTGYSDSQWNKVRAAANRIPIFHASNLSVGAHLLLQISKYAAQALGSAFDISIIEHHHKLKTDCPSGTAKALAHELHHSSPILSIRAGTSNGKHSALFIGEHEILEFSHTVDSRTVYAIGAKNAVRFLYNVKKPGFYSMNDLLNSPKSI